MHAEYDFFETYQVTEVELQLNGGNGTVKFYCMNISVSVSKNHDEFAQQVKIFYNIPAISTRDPKSLLEFPSFQTCVFERSVLMQH